MKDYNLEFAHIYLSDTVSAEHFHGLKEARKFINRRPTRTISSTILIDDYNPKTKKLDIDSFLQELKTQGLAPDFVALESKLTRGGQALLKKAYDSRIKRSYENYIRNHNKYPCSFLIAVWNLIRLGLIPIPDGLFYQARKSPKSFAAQKIYTILPRYYVTAEQKALDLLTQTPWSVELARVKHLYLDEFTTFQPGAKKDIF